MTYAEVYRRLLELGADPELWTDSRQLDRATLLVRFASDLADEIKGVVGEIRGKSVRVLFPGLDFESPFGELGSPVLRKGGKCYRVSLAEMAYALTRLLRRSGIPVKGISWSTVGGMTANYDRYEKLVAVAEF